jgi:Ricin-type beta-trefoil lectin domain
MITSYKVWRFVLATLAGTALVLSLGAPAQALTYPMAKNAATGLCLDSNSPGSVYTLTCNGGLFQRWIITNLNGGLQMKNWATGKCLYTVSPSPSFVGAGVCDGTSWTLWTETKSGSHRMYTNLAHGRCLDSNAQGQVYIHACNAGNFQKWLLMATL